ncbi:g812 [Coccomyxa viridis]|uniref:G812 protein n=1 Tax=Coccomyxa viridis TaxID=1274662 RepID=A0ABP1FLZ0_9CHLO
MSQVYNLEPPTKGKVILKTSLGDIDIELWPKEAPKAVRNFVQLCLEGYYDNTPFFRIDKGFMAQAGDPTGTGLGGESVYGHPFNDEFHSRLKFNHRGLVACANQNAPHTNNSQFFITMDRCDHLDRKNTIFGKVTGESIYNAMRLNEQETDDDLRPINPPIVQGADVLWSPFDDIYPRSTKEDREEAEAAKKAADKAAATEEKKKHKKNLKVLSFGDDVEEDEEEADMAPRVMKSAHDATNDARLLREETAEAAALREKEAAEEAERQRVRASIRGALKKPGGAEADGNAPSSSAAEQPDGADDFGAQMRAAAQARRQDLGKAPEQRAVDPEAETEDDSDGDGEPENGVKDRVSKALGGTATRGKERISKRVHVEDAELLTDWQRRQAEFKQRRAISGAEGSKAKQERMKQFQQRLRGASAAEKPAPAPKAEPAAEVYNGQVAKGVDHEALMPAAWRLDKYLDADVDEDEDISLASLRGHRLTYDKSQQRDDMARNDNVDDLTVEDPLALKGKGKGEAYNKVKAKEKRKEREWTRNK